MVLAWMVNAFVTFFIVWAAAHMLLKQRRGRKSRRELVISPMSGLAMGAMLLGLQAIVQPQARHAIIEEQKEEAFDDEGGGEPPGGRAYYLQLQRIRRGEDVRDLTVKVDPGLGDEGGEGED
jgi:hypothetical protein